MIFMRNTTEGLVGGYGIIKYSSRRSSRHAVGERGVKPVSVTVYWL